jgi:hypothetical protein
MKQKRNKNETKDETKMKQKRNKNETKTKQRRTSHPWQWLSHPWQIKIHFRKVEQNDIKKLKYLLATQKKWI